MAKVYVSSTYSDLKDHREAVYDALRKLRHDAIAMEDYVATDQRPLAKCLEDVADCDLYVGIFAWRYGYIPEEPANLERKSITELEYRQAGKASIPRLIFLLDESVAWPPGLMDAVTGEGEGGTLIKALRKTLGTEHTVSFFTTAEELAGLVAVAVANELKAEGEGEDPPPATYHAEQRGSGAIAQGREAQAAGERGVVLKGNVHGNISTGDHTERPHDRSAPAQADEEGDEA